MEKLFQLQAHGSNVRREVMGGLTTFAAMAYILAVNPTILQAGGMDFGAVFTATALASALMTAFMGLLTNYPIALAPGMGMNAFFAFTVCVGMDVPWQAALAMVFVSGLLFLLLTFTGIRRRIIEILPHEMKVAVSCGIGLFIAFIGFKNAGLIVPNEATFVSLGDLSSPSVLLTLLGLALTAILVQRRIPGAVMIGIAILTLVGMFLPAVGTATDRLTPIPDHVIAWPASVAPTFLKFDFRYLLDHPMQVTPIILAFLFVDVFDNLGTLIGVTHRAGLLNEQGQLPRLGRALTADATAAMVGSTLGTSTVTSYIESAAGVEEGGRTGLTAMVVAACFLLALFFHPIISIVPAAATAPALIVVGIFMMQGISSLDLRDFSVAAPACTLMLAMPLTFSISDGLAIGFVVYVLFQVGINRAHEVRPLAYAMALVFLLHLIFGQ